MLVSKKIRWFCYVGGGKIKRYYEFSLCLLYVVFELGFGLGVEGGSGERE